MSEPAPTPIPAERLAEARQAMEGELWRKKREAEAQVLLARREEARRAMEGRDRQLKRQTEEAEKLRIKNQAAAMAEVAATKLAGERAQAKSAVEAEREKAMQTAAREMTEQRQAAATATKIEKMKAAPNEMSAVRTFKTDLAAAAAGGASITKAIIQGQKPNVQGTPEPSQESHAGRWLLFILLLLLLGGGAFGYVYWQKSLPQSPTNLGPITATSTSPGLVKPLFIFTDKQIKIEMDKLNRADFILQLRQAINDGTPVPGQITSIIPTRADKPLTFNSWLTESQITLTEKLTQTFEPKFLLGRYDTADRAAAFLILETKKYPAAFAAIRQDEADLVPLFYLLTGRESFRPPVDGSEFNDRLSQNLELRELSRDGVILFLYTFLDQNTLVIAEDEAALLEILARREVNS